MKFKDLVFSNKTYIINASHLFENGLILSVSCGEMAYCTPRTTLSSEKDYSSFEIAILHEGRFITRFLLDKHNNDDDVMGWVDRDEINEVIKLIEKATKEDIDSCILDDNLLKYKLQMNEDKKIIYVKSEKRVNPLSKSPSPNIVNVHYLTRIMSYDNIHFPIPYIEELTSTCINEEIDPIIAIELNGKLFTNYSSYKK